jgi:exopolysaccharide/PEP-CTERM locus tyrosine autokinase
MSRIEDALEKAVRRREPSAPYTGPSIQENVETEAQPLKTKNPYVIRFTEQDLPIAEEYRKLRSMILRMTKKQTNDNILMVTSAESGEGKSLTATNLALVLAQEYNHTVLLVDADLRRPTLHNLLGLEPVLGLSDCLADGIDVGRALAKTGIPKLSFLCSGRKTSKPAELLSSNKMKVLIHELKHRYPDRYIIIDTPPALLFSETHAISSYVDGILFIVKEGTASNSVRDALDILKGGPVLGIVYNNASPQQLDRRYHHYYQYYKQQRNEVSHEKG